MSSQCRRVLVVASLRHVCRPADRTGEDLDLIYARLKDLKAFEKFHPLLLQQICYYSYYEDLEQGVICECRRLPVSLWSLFAALLLAYHCAETGQ